MQNRMGEVLKINAKLAEPFKIRIWEDRTKGGCRWVPTFDTQAFRLLSDEYERTQNIRVSDIGMRTFEFIPMTSGKTVISFESRYGWKFSAENNMTYEVTVTE
ncbi:MAG: protease inhibitor I42 family protein [Nitrospiria bacterium]